MPSHGSSPKPTGLLEVYFVALDAIGRPLGWQLGVVWEVDAADGRLRCVRACNAGALAEECD
jgi:hypothetical protein